MVRYCSGFNQRVREDATALLYVLLRANQVREKHTKQDNKKRFSQIFFY